MEGKEEKKRMQILRTGTLNKGFTLLELLVVIFILSLVVAVVFPSFYRFGEKRIDIKAKRIASILKYVNESAISRKEIFKLKFDFNKKIITYDTPEGEKNERFPEITGIYLPSRGEVKEGELIIFFPPTGIEENLIVHIKEGKDEILVKMNALSGRVKIEKNV